MEKLLIKLRENTISRQELERLEKIFEEQEASIDAAFKEEIETIERRIAQKQKVRRLATFSWVKNPARTLSIAASLLLIGAFGFYFLRNESTIAEKWTGHVEMDSVFNAGRVPKKVRLPDGSVAFLGPSSYIRFPSKFTSKTREVRSKGVVYYEVAHDSLSPFVVSLQNSRITVLGTVFTVDNSDQTNEHIELLKGSVKVDYRNKANQELYRILKPGEKLSYSAQNAEMVQTLINPAVQIDWNSGVITFDKATIHEIAQTLGNWYDIQIRIPAEFSSQERIVHRIDTRQMSVDEIIEGINLIVKYKIEKEREGQFTVLQ
ncbi:FecR domain-containing protein [Marinilongibacter aquaticus]|uniref:FecR family protein n=1 Tax=Marinilongibacter aquaticus TaxID=2975157 RepID=UPI0021BD1E7F|nr:FecR family protein [Marinilongibacter aquaticus]UBM58620.1 FecR domain-containing protein [Marinilongibacter aquaticus]